MMFPTAEDWTDGFGAGAGPCRGMTLFMNGSIDTRGAGIGVLSTGPKVSEFRAISYY